METELGNYNVIDIILKFLFQSLFVSNFNLKSELLYFQLNIFTVSTYFKLLIQNKLLNS